MLIFQSKCHVMAYDIECEYFGESSSYIESLILCVCLRCTCGYIATVSRTPLAGIKHEYIVAPTNFAIAEATMALIISHQPIFTVGHNVYEFDNVRLTVLCHITPGIRRTFNPRLIW
ncbi:hypothetical protein ACHAW6_005075 [Cyclotella cf. meneghiniana]